ncbi:hypothetical protein HDV03_003500 [Kappamyces sp. JEL0829]|nr:hypothetical protein HDV03_003500 [Kappamyces sp. JEL0829]
MVVLSASLLLSLVFAALPQQSLFAPYVDVSGSLDVGAVATATGQKFFSLAFINADASGNAVFGGGSVASNFYSSQIKALRAQGGDVMVSFGGALAQGKMLASVTASDVALQAKYQQIVDQYKLSWLDFDVEGGNLGDSATNKRRAKALVNLKKANPGLVVSFTLPVAIDGVTATGVQFLKDMSDSTLAVDYWNLMTMDFGPAGTGTKMSEFTISAGEAFKKQLDQFPAYKGGKIGLTPMVGVNDVKDEVFGLKDAQIVLKHAQSDSRIAYLGMWSVNRDNGDMGPIATSSGIQQSKFEFISIWKGFTSGAAKPPPTFSSVSSSASSAATTTPAASDVPVAVTASALASSQTAAASTDYTYLPTTTQSSTATPYVEPQPAAAQSVVVTSTPCTTAQPAATEAVYPSQAPAYPAQAPASAATNAPSAYGAIYSSSTAVAPYLWASSLWILVSIL